MSIRNTSLASTSARTTLAFGAVLGLAASLLGGCYDPAEGVDLRTPDKVFVVPNSDLSATIRDAEDNFVSEIDAVHVVGGNGCPQALGTVLVDNEGDEAAHATVELVADPPVAIEITEGRLEVPAGGSAEFEVAFNCSSTDDIAELMELSVEFGGRVSVFEIPVTLDVQM